MLCIHVVTYLTDVSRRSQRERHTADNKAESWQVVDLAAVHHVLEIETRKTNCLRATGTQTNLYIVSKHSCFYVLVQVCFSTLTSNCSKVLLKGAACENNSIFKKMNKGGSVRECLAVYPFISPVHTGSVELQWPA